MTSSNRAKPDMFHLVSISSDTFSTITSVNIQMMKLPNSICITIHCVKSTAHHCDINLKLLIKLRVLNTRISIAL